jgi:hypothetical protein
MILLYRVAAFETKRTKASGIVWGDNDFKKRFTDSENY